MKFEVEGDNEAILKALESYRETFNSEYEKNLEVTKDKLKGAGMGNTGAIPNFQLLFWQENDKVIVSIPIQLPKFVKWLKGEKKVGEKFGLFFKAQGIEIKNIRYIGD